MSTYANESLSKRIRVVDLVTGLVVAPRSLPTDYELSGIRKQNVQKSDLSKSGVLLCIGYLPIFSFSSGHSPLFPSTNVPFFQPIEDGHG